MANRRALSCNRPRIQLDNVCSLSSLKRWKAAGWGEFDEEKSLNADCAVDCVIRIRASVESRHIQRGPIKAERRGASDDGHPLGARIQSQLPGIESSRCAPKEVSQHDLARRQDHDDRANCKYFLGSVVGHILG